MQLNLARFRTTESAGFLNSHGTLTSSNVLTDLSDLSKHFLTDLSKHCKTYCGFVNMARKAEITRWKIFFQSKLQAFQHSERIWTAFRADL